jgi:hypothetical protein
MELAPSAVGKLANRGTEISGYADPLTIILRSIQISANG